MNPIVVVKEEDRSRATIVPGKASGEESSRPGNPYSNGGHSEGRTASKYIGWYCFLGGGGGSDPALYGDERENKRNGKSEMLTAESYTSRKSRVHTRMASGTGF